MKKPGRPSLAELDREDLVYMAELWCAGKANLSIRKIARIVAGLEAASMTSIPRYSQEDEASMKPKPSSKAKRLERRFEKLRDEHKAISLSVYRVLNQEWKIAMKAHGKTSYGHFHIEDTADTKCVQANEIALKRTAVRCAIAKCDIAAIAVNGLNILREWFPREYPQNKI
jgi:hypothetical protein